jgi:hypothetical protein
MRGSSSNGETKSNIDLFGRGQPCFGVRRKLWHKLMRCPRMSSTTWWIGSSRVDNNTGLCQSSCSRRGRVKSNAGGECSDWDWELNGSEPLGGGESSLTGGGPILFVDSDILAECPLEGSRRLSKSVLAADDKSMKGGSVGRVSGEPLLVPDERSEGAPAERPREESDPTLRSGGTEEPEKRFTIGCASPVVDGCRWGGTPANDDDDDDPRVARLLNVRLSLAFFIIRRIFARRRSISSLSGRGMLDTEMSESAESPEQRQGAGQSGWDG